jgi:predicted DNA-binding ribbon-helix-helix protein
LLDGRKTSLSLEGAFWYELKKIAASESIHVSDLVSIIDKKRQHMNLSSAVRLFILDHYRSYSSAQSPAYAHAVPSEETRRADLLLVPVKERA